MGSRGDTHGIAAVTTLAPPGVSREILCTKAHVRVPVASRVVLNRLGVLSRVRSERLSQTRGILRPLRKGEPRIIQAISNRHFDFFVQPEAAVSIPLGIKRLLVEDGFLECSQRAAKTFTKLLSGCAILASYLVV